MPKSRLRVPPAADSGAETRVRIGRPRAQPELDNGTDPREAILAVASELFNTRGFRHTSTTAIASAVGLRQASLFYYFPRKEDILRELLDRTVRRSLEFVAALQTVEAPPDVKLYMLVYNDLETINGPPGHLSWLMFQPDARTDQFADFWRRHEELLKTYEEFVALGGAQDLFDIEDAHLSARIVCGLVEGASNWSGPEFVTSDPRVWQAVTDHALRSLLRTPSRLTDVRKQADMVQAQLAPIVERSCG